MQSFVKLFENSIRTNWSSPALNDYRGDSMTYADLAREIATLHLLWKNAGLKQGDKIALNARSGTNWAVLFMAATTGGYVATQLLSGFTPADTQNLVNHSESRILYTEKAIFDGMNFDEMPQLVAAIDMKSKELLASRGNFDKFYKNTEHLFDAAYGDKFTPESVSFIDWSFDKECCLNYTSGSTGNPKGVMLTIGNLSSNVNYLADIYPYTVGDRYLSALPYAHIFGLVFEVMTPLCSGMHVTVLCNLPAPTILKDAFQQVRPRMVMMVPLVIDKITEYSIGEFVHSKTGEARLGDYTHHTEFCNGLRSIFLNFLGGNCEMIFTGGTAIPSELEILLIDKLRVPLITGYGMTECAPMIAAGILGDYKKSSCGKIVARMQVRIDSDNPQDTVGEVLVKGENVFNGYYKNPDADKVVFTKDGWLRTGDLGTLDADGTLFLVGRCKSMLLTTNGQNVYPEEIEVKLNAMPYVAESIIVQRGERFVAIIVPDAERLANDGVSSGTLLNVMNRNVDTLNKSIPAYSQVVDYELRDEPFAKTPKGSIKRFMYS